jgi:16S rRNA (guanine527-N7)-methyltransferase
MRNRYERALPRLCTYFSELNAWNRRVNLTGLKSLDQMISKHLGDTMVLDQWLPSHVRTLLDIGTGAGIPGLILKILHPDLDVWLLDARRKRVSFLNAVIAELGINGVHAVHGRAGEGAGLPVQDAPGCFDMVTSQAVGSVSALADMAEEFLKPGGIAVSMKGPGGEEELRLAIPELEKRGWQARAVQAVTPAEKLKRFLVIMEKTGA